MADGAYFKVARTCATSLRIHALLRHYCTRAGCVSEFVAAVTGVTAARLQPAAPSLYRFLVGPGLVWLDAWVFAVA